MTLKKTRSAEVKAIRRATRLNIPQARELARAYDSAYRYKVPHILEGFGVEIVDTFPGIECYIHPGEGSSTLIMKHRGRCFILEGSCCGYSLPQPVPWVG